jgi:hypothetical protein
MVNSKIKNIIKKLILEAYVDSQGKLGDFNSSPYNMDMSDDTSPLYDPELPKDVNRFKDTINQGKLASLTIEIPRQQKAFIKALNIARKGIKMGTQVLKLSNFKFNTIGKIHKYQFNTKFVPLIKSILKQLSEEDSLSDYVDDYKELASMIK